MFKIASIAASLMLLAGCSGFEQYLKSMKGHDGGSFRQDILDMLDSDTKSLKEIGLYVHQGRIPRDFRQIRWNDERFNRRSSPNRGRLEMLFEKAEDGRICFLRSIGEVVGNDESLQEALARLTRIAESYDFAIEAHTSIDSPESRTREIWPTHSAPDLDTTEVVDTLTKQVYERGELRTRLTAEFRDCGDLPPLTPESRFLTVAVRPHNSSEFDTAYVMFWVLTDSEGKGSIREDAAVAGNTPS
ncbi:hypothetical protein ACLESO_27020 [Pyxidicoccus sp. 3LG]